MPDLELLRSVTFGSRVAEDEVDALESYFVQTQQWARILNGEVDIVYGPKGSGKSALYSLLAKRVREFRDRGIVLIPAENPRGAAAFQDLEHDPPTSEIEFTAMWKLYFISLLAGELSTLGIKNDAERELQRVLEEAGLRRGTRSLGSLVHAIVSYVRSIRGVEGGVNFDSATGAPTGVTGKITLGEPTPLQRKLGMLSVDELIRLADEAWSKSGLTAWILLDRLDVAFADNSELEENALRALFKVYLDLIVLKSVKIKIFLRSDLWKRLARKGFREASHITRETTITWDPPSLLNLIVRRLLTNKAVRVVYGINEENEPRSYRDQLAFFERVFPEQIDLGERKSSTIDWILGRVRDGTGQSAPREVIHLLNAARDRQCELLERGETDSGKYLIGRAAFKQALAEVSLVRLEKTIYAEHPALQGAISKLDGEKTAQSSKSLAGIWGVSEEEAGRMAADLVEVGLFEERGSKADPEYWVPFLYRDALRMVQGSAD